MNLLFVFQMMWESGMHMASVVVVVLVWLECVCCGRWCSIAVFTAVEPVALSVPVVIEVVVAVEVGDKRR